MERVLRIGLKQGPFYIYNDNSPIEVGCNIALFDFFMDNVAQSYNSIIIETLKRNQNETMSSSTTTVENTPESKFNFFYTTGKISTYSKTQKIKEKI